MFRFTIFLNLFLYSMCCYNDCYDDWPRWDGWSYLFVSQPLNFDDAIQHCREKSSYLAFVDDEMQNIFTAYRQNFPQKNLTDFWIGGKKLQTSNNTWNWKTVSIFWNPVEFTSWDVGEPQDSTDNLCISSSIVYGKWKASDCRQLKPFVCKTYLKWGGAKQSHHSDEESENVNLPPPLICSKGWLYFAPTDSCIGIGYIGQNGPIIKNWTEAENFCATKFDGHLPSVHSLYEFEIIDALTMISRTPVWTGLRSHSDDGKSWTWSDGTAVDYLPWFHAYDYPKPFSTESCATGDLSFLWNQDCSNEAAVICKHPSRKELSKLFGRDLKHKNL